VGRSPEFRRSQASHFDSRKWDKWDTAEATECRVGVFTDIR